MFNDALDPDLAHEVSGEAAGWLAMAATARCPRLARLAAWTIVPFAWLACSNGLLTVASGGRV